VGWRFVNNNNAERCCEGRAASLMMIWIVVKMCRQFVFSLTCSSHHHRHPPNFQLLLLSADLPKIVSAEAMIVEEKYIPLGPNSAL